MATEMNRVIFFFTMIKFYFISAREHEQGTKAHQQTIRTARSQQSFKKKASKNTRNKLNPLSLARRVIQTHETENTNKKINFLH